MTQPTLRAACTIASPNYLPFVRTLASSYLEQHPGHRFFVLLVADLSDAVAFAGQPFTPVLLSEIGLPDLRVEAMKYDILEFNTNVKPTLMKHLLTAHGLASLIYLDPDIFCYSPLTPVFDALETHDAVLTPHITSPIWDGKAPGEQDLLVNGTYNLGFIAVRHTPEALRLLDWWERRCLDLGFSEGRTGLFVDQKWMNLAPGLFEHVCILRHPGCNMAYWNLHERSLTPLKAGDPTHAEGPSSGYTVQCPQGAAPLCFFHFSGIDVADPAALSRHTDRFTLAQRPDLTRLFMDYKARVLANGDERLDSLPYGFDTFSDGISLTRLARRIYSGHLAHFAGHDPFDAAAPWARYAVRHRLVAGKTAAQKSTWRDFSLNDRRVALVHRLLALMLRLLGPHRYELLMRYLGHITVLRNQSVFLSRDLPKS